MEEMHHLARVIACLDMGISKMDNVQDCIFSSSQRIESAEKYLQIAFCRKGVAPFYEHPGQTER